MLFDSLYNALENQSKIFDDCEGNGLRYDIPTKIGYVNIQVNMEYGNNTIEFDIFKVKGTPLTPENEDLERIAEFGGYVSELDIGDGYISRVSLMRNGYVQAWEDSDTVKEVLEEMERRFHVDLA